METEKIFEIKFSGEETIVSATLSNFDECVMLLSSGDVIRYNLLEQTGQHLFSVGSQIERSDGGFDIQAPSTIYTLDSIVVVVNDYKCQGFIHYPGHYNSLHLWREDYHADISRFPIALYKDLSGTPHIIYSVAWNHIQIMNLSTLQILTAAKSLIEEGAEERHIAFYSNHTEGNKSPWPRPYDYFFGKLYMSPSQRKFLSAGWAWGSYDCYNVYDIQEFITNNRISHQAISGWEHDNRTVCWINDNTVIVTYNPDREGDENTTPETPSEIHFYNIAEKKSILERRIAVKGINITNYTLYYDTALDVLIALSFKEGVAILSRDGIILYRDQYFKADEYYPAFRLFLKKGDRSISLYGIKS
ncbi:hypothetical protein [Xanthocytophaga agilis]|uniref:Uncharacterized protein n=1 Tax=Xanthocytophaga agilis TaxID=3048010 RepID=A0AAE3R758_9BACT|nr:hypothetical protein [Xanthocytophaga agilis]MDJ1502827.1 hypothetical protein [Xanthocytophaga agilis]